MLKDGSFNLDQKYFNYSTGLTMTNDEFSKLFGKKPRVPDKDKIEQFHMDIAASIQSVTEEIVIKIVSDLKKEFQIDNLCLAGGVALNCVANGKILKKNIFKNIWIQPAAGDAGGALGSILAFWYNEKNHKRIESSNDKMKGSFLGPEFSQKTIEERLIKLDANFDVLDDELLIDKTAECLSNGDAVGWFQGRMEFGPRALGGRSILADPRSSSTQKILI